MRRRQVLSQGWRWGVSLACGPGGVLFNGVQAHPRMGPVQPPLPLPAVHVTDQQGRTQDLRSWLQGSVTAVQTMYTGCGSVCPIQGALFAEVQAQWSSRPSKGAHRVRWLSLSIDPMSDTPNRLKEWLARWQAAPGWDAARPDPLDLDALLQCLHGPPAGATSPPVTAASEVSDAGHHPARVFVLNAQAQVVWRTPPLPSTGEVLRLLSYWSDPARGG